MTDFIYEDAFEPDVNIKVVGVGGGGGNALNCMVASGVQDIEYIAINTDAKALNNSKATTRIQIGAKLTKGRGAGNKPTIGQQSAEENKEEIEAALKGADMVFITAGMGGGTGTGAAPVVARLAQEAGILTVAVVTKPFAFEREQKMAQAEKGIMELKKYVDSLIVIPNEKLLEGMDKPLTMRESFALADDILKTGVKSISDLIVEEGYINLDFADVSTIMKGAGYAHLATSWFRQGQGKGSCQCRYRKPAAGNFYCRCKTLVDQYYNERGYSLFRCGQCNQDDYRQGSRQCRIYFWYSLQGRYAG